VSQLSNVEIVKAFVLGDPHQPDHAVQGYDDTLEKRLEAASPTDDLEDPTGCSTTSIPTRSCASPRRGRTAETTSGTWATEASRPAHRGERP
jgi:hypothetical protein